MTYWIRYPINYRKPGWQQVSRDAYEFCVQMMEAGKVQGYRVAIMESTTK